MAPEHPAETIGKFAVEGTTVVDGHRRTVAAGAGVGPRIRNAGRRADRDALLDSPFRKQHQIPPGPRPDTTTPGTAIDHRVRHDLASLGIEQPQVTRMKRWQWWADTLEELASHPAAIRPDPSLRRSHRAKVAKGIAKAMARSLPPKVPAHQRRPRKVAAVRRQELVGVRAAALAKQDAEREARSKRKTEPVPEKVAGLVAKMAETDL